MTDLLAALLWIALGFVGCSLMESIRGERRRKREARNDRGSM